MVGKIWIRTFSLHNNSFIYREVLSIGKGDNSFIYWEGRQQFYLLGRETTVLSIGKGDNSFIYWEGRQQFYLLGKETTVLSIGKGDSLSIGRGIISVIFGKKIYWEVGQ